MGTPKSCKKRSRNALINPHQRCGYGDSPFARRDTFVYCRIQKWNGKGSWQPGTHKRKLYLRKKHVFVTETYVEDARQDGKNISDLLKALMRPTDPVQEELRSFLFKMDQCGSKITKIRISTFWRSGNPKFSRWRAMPTCSPLSFKQPRPFPCNIWPR